MCGPMRGAVCGAIVFEGWAGDLAAAEKLAASGAVKFAPNHHFGAVGPMTGITTRSMPLLVVENRTFGNRAACTHQRRARQGDALRRQRCRGARRASRWLRDEFGPLLGKALRTSAAVPLNPLIARGLTMGDEMHQRNVACTSLLLRIAGAEARRKASRRSSSLPATTSSSSTWRWRWARASSTRRAASPARPSSRRWRATAPTSASASPGWARRWFTAPVEMPQGLYFPGLQRRRCQSGHRRLGDPRGDRPGRVLDGRGARGRRLRRRRRLSRRGRRPRAP